MRIALLCLLLTGCGLGEVISESRRVMVATADAVEKTSEAMEEVVTVIKDVRSGEFDWEGLIAGALGGAVAGGGGGFLAGRKKR